MNAQPEQEQPEEKIETTIASAIAGELLRQVVEKGGVIEIPSLGIKLTKDNLRDVEGEQKAEK